MHKDFQIIQITRSNILDVLAGLSIEEINTIPANFNNNLVWHLGHIIASQQALCYKLSGLEPKVDMQVFSKYSKGTKPESYINAETYNSFKDLAVATIESTFEDYKSGSFINYTEYTTSYGITLNSIEDAFQFVSVHEGLHLGYIMALKRAVLV